MSAPSPTQQTQDPPRSLFGADITTRGMASAHGAAQAGAAGGLSGLLGGGVGAVPGMLAYGAYDLFSRIVTGTLQDPSPAELGKPAQPGEMLAWWARHPGSLEEERARYPGIGAGTIAIFAPEGAPASAATFDAFTGEFLYWGTAGDRVTGYPPPSDPSWAWNQPTTPTPTPTPVGGEWSYVPPAPQPTQSETPYGYPDSALGPQANGGNIMSIMSPASLLGGLGSLIRDVGELAVGTAPIWTPFLPRAGSTPQIGPGGGIGGGMSQFPIAMPGGAPIGASLGGPVYLPGVTPALGLPGVDLAPSGSIPITPNPVTGNLPSQVLAPYTTRCGTRSWTIYRKMGRPVLMSGDYAAARRVKRAGAKARRRSGGR